MIMTSQSQATSGDTSTAHESSVRALCREVQEHLDALKRALDEEIRSYPTPIPRCDAQFNNLYDERARLAGALARLRAALAEDASLDLVAEALAACVADAPFSSGADEGSLRERVNTTLRGAAPPSGSRTNPSAARGPA